MGAFLLFARSKAGRSVLVVGIITLLILGALGRSFLAGKRSEKSKQKEADLKNLKKRLEADEEIERMDSTELDEFLSGWMRDSEG